MTRERFEPHEQRPTRREASALTTRPHVRIGTYTTKYSYQTFWDRHCSRLLYNFKHKLFSLKRIIIIYSQTQIRHKIIIIIGWLDPPINISSLTINYTLVALSFHCYASYLLWNNIQLLFFLHLLWNVNTFPPLYITRTKTPPDVPKLGRSWNINLK